MSEPEQRAVEGLAHLQGAAVQLIAAARAFLDVAEDLVTDPAAAGAVVQTLGALAGLVTHAGERPPQETGPRPAPWDGDAGGRAGGAGARVTRIPVAEEP